MREGGAVWPLTTNPNEYTRRTYEVRQAILTGHRPSTPPRPVISASWRRIRSYGLDPEGSPERTPLQGSGLADYRMRSGLAAFLPQLRVDLAPAAESASQLLVIADAHGNVLWREGTPAVLRHADGLGFVEGSAWTEGNVGTNAIGTCLVTGTPVHVHAAEHFARTHTSWTCAAAPLHDPLSGRLLGVVDLSGGVRTVNAGTVRLVGMAARLVELELREAHRRRLAPLRDLAGPLLARLSLDSRAIVIAQDGAVAGVLGAAASDFIALPSDFGAATTWMPELGAVSVEPIPGGWLIGLHDDAHAVEEAIVTTLVLDASTAEPVVRVSSENGTWSYIPSPRHCEIILALIVNRFGRTAAQLADDLFADPSRTVTVRAEMSRLRRTFGPVLLSQPYRFVDTVSPSLILPGDMATLMPHSSAPVVGKARFGRGRAPAAAR